MLTLRRGPSCLREWTVAFCLLAALFLAPSIASAQQQTDISSDKWRVSVSPYLWLAGLDGNVTLAGHEAPVSQSFADIFSNLKFGVMGFTEARRGRVALLTDLMWVRIGDQKAIPVGPLPVATQVTLTSTTFTLTPEAAFRVYGSRHFAADVLGGFRYYHVGANTTFDMGQLGERKYTGSDNWADVTGGGRLVVLATRKLGAFVLGDAGVGGSAQSWELAYGSGYALTKTITTQIGYRRLYFNRNSEKNFAMDATQKGLVVGATFHLR